MYAIIKVFNYFSNGNDLKNINIKCQLDNWFLFDGCVSVVLQLNRFYEKILSSP